MTFEHLRENYNFKPLSVKKMHQNPLEQLKEWLGQAIHLKETEPNAMALATTGENNQPSVRHVLLKKITADGIVFYTNYSSKKAEEIEKNSAVAATFYWKSLGRQVTIEGKAMRISRNESEDYFSKRPRGSQIAAWASSQGNPLNSREELEGQFAHFETLFKDKEVPCPKHWGGYLIQPHYFDFWQGQPNRMHDRFLYRKDGDSWLVTRISP